MSGKRSAEIRMEQARAHAALGEPFEALAALARAAREEPGVPGLLALVEELIDGGESSPEQRICRAGLQVLREQLLASFEALAAGPAASGAALATPPPPPEPPCIPAALQAQTAELPAPPPVYGAGELADAELLADAEPLESGEPLESAADADAEPEPFEPEPLDAEPLAEEPTPADLGVHPAFLVGRGEPAGPGEPHDRGEPLGEIALEEALDDEPLEIGSAGAGALSLEAEDDEDEPLAAAPAAVRVSAAQARLQVLERWLANAREQRSRA